MKEKKVNRFHNLLTFLRPHKGGLSIPYPINSRGSYPYNTSYHDYVIERDMFWYFIKKTHFPGAFHILNICSLGGLLSHGSTVVVQG